MVFDNIAMNAGAWAWSHLESGFFQFIERKIENGEKQLPTLKELHRRWMTFDWGFAAKTYRQHLEEYYGQFQVFGMGEVKLSELFTDVFILDNQYPESPFDQRIIEHKPTSGLRIISETRGHRLFIWGLPGAGKTTFLKHILHNVLEKQPDKIPIFISINDWTTHKSPDYKSLIEYVIEQFSFLGLPNATLFINYILEEGHAVLLLDGLDEALGKYRYDVDKTLDAFCNNPIYKKTQCVMTCRFEGTHHNFGNFTHVRIANWDENRIRHFVSRRFLDPTMQEKFVQALNDGQNRSISELKKTPLLLALLCAAFEPYQSFPAKKALIYQVATRQFLKDRDIQHSINRDEIYKNLTLAQLESLYANLAYYYFEKGQQTFEQIHLEKQISITLANILKINDAKSIDGTKILSDLVTQHGFITKRGGYTYTFTHLTFQEYYAAMYFTENIHTKNNLNIAECFSDARWREVFLLGTSLLDEADTFLEVIQRSLPTILTKDTHLKNIHNWVTKKANQIQIEDSSEIVRCFYWYIFIAQALACAVTNDFMMDIKRTFTLNSDLDQGINQALNQAINHANNFTKTLVEAIGLNHILVLDRAFSSSYSRARPQNIQFNLKFTSSLMNSISTRANNRQNLKKLIPDLLTTNLLLVLIFCEEFIKVRNFNTEQYINLNTYYCLWQKCFDGYTEIANLPLPKEKATHNEWLYFLRTLHILIIRYLNNGNLLELSNTQNQLIGEYLQANNLLLSCLDLAYVSNRKKILENLLL